MLKHDLKEQEVQVKYNTFKAVQGMFKVHLTVREDNATVSQMIFLSFKQQPYVPLWQCFQEKSCSGENATMVQESLDVDRRELNTQTISINIYI